MPLPPLRALVLVCALVPATACGLLGEHPSARRRPAPSPSPALAKAETKGVLNRYELRLNLANRRLWPQVATVALTGSALQLQIAKYKIAKANGIPLTAHRYGSALSAVPRFTGYPRWFFAALTDRAVRPHIREITVFLQDRAGAQWRAAYAPTTTRAAGPLAAGVRVADFPDVPAGDDATLALAPSRVAGAVADLLNHGRASAYHRAIRTAPWIIGARHTLGERRVAHRGEGWTGSAAYAPAPFPAYAIRTTSGGALVWAAVDLHASYRHTRPGAGFTWRSAAWGDLLRPFIGRPAAQRLLTTGERFEFVAYVPPRGKGQVRFLADRWFPFSAKGH